MNPNMLVRDEKLFRYAQMDPSPVLHQSTRRALLAGLAAVALGVAAVALIDPPGWFPLVVPVLSANQFVFRWLARRGTRGLTLAPADLLDERQLHDVHGAYRRAYSITIVAVVGLVAVFLFGPDFETASAGVIALLFLLHLMLWLPTCVLAWRLHDEEPEPGTATA